MAIEGHTDEHVQAALPRRLLVLGGEPIVASLPKRSPATSETTVKRHEELTP